MENTYENTIAYFDLEETIINEFNVYGYDMVNVEKIKKIISDNNISDIIIFSFAIHDEKDKADFVQCFKTPIEQAFHVTVNDKVDSIMDMSKIFTKNHRMSTMSKSDFFDFINKERMMIEYVQYMIKFNGMKNTRIIFVDDVIPDADYIFKTPNVKIEFINIKNYIT